MLQKFRSKFKHRLPVLLVFSLIVFAIEVDISVPSFPDMLKYFATTECCVQWTLSINFFGFCLAGLFYGPLSDAFGRRNIMLIGVSIFTLGSIGCALANSIENMLLMRFIQGIGASSGIIIVYAVIADIYSQEKATAFIGIMNSFLTIFMSIAPTIGSFLVQSFGWRSNFTVVGLLSLVVLLLLAVILPETHTDNRNSFNFRKIMQGYKELLTNKSYIIYASGPGFMLGAYLAFVASVPFLYINVFHMEQMIYGIHLAAVVMSFSIVSFVSGKIIKWLGMYECILFSGIICFILGFIIFILNIYQYLTPNIFTILMCIISVGVALCYGGTTVICLSVQTKNKGLSSSGLMSIRFLLASFTVLIVGMYYDGSFFPVTIVMFICYLLAAISLFYAHYRVK